MRSFEIMPLTLSKDIYQAFEDIVGPSNISEDPLILDTYRQVMAQTASHLGPHYRVMTPRGLAVILPGSTEEVQSIVRLCNKYRIKFKASTTFWSAMGNISDDYAIQLDMRRMDRILKIDEKNLYAVIEPYVIGATLQAEAMKVGLYPMLIGAGASTSPLAGAVGWLALGPSAPYIGNNGEAMLGMEYVLPDGELIRTGSAGAGLDWFCGEGPGPSVRSILRGGYGEAGSIGVCTKIALKLGPWPGPAQLPTEGTIPAYRAVLPNNIRGHTICFPTWEAWANAVYMCWNGGLGYIFHRQYNKFGRDLKGAMIRILSDPTKTLSDLEELLKDPKVKEQTEEMKIDTQIVLAGMTKRDIEYQEQLLDKILAETGGWKASMMEEADVANWSLLYLIRMGHKNLNYAFAGGYEGCGGIIGVPDAEAPRIEEFAEVKRRWEVEHDHIANVGGDSWMATIGTLGGGATMKMEYFTHFDCYDQKSTEGTKAFFDTTSAFMTKKGWGSDMARINDDVRGADGYGIPSEKNADMYRMTPQPLNYEYQWKVKHAIDPNNLGDYYYRTLKPQDL